MSALIRSIFRGWNRSESFWDKDGMDDNLRFIGDHMPVNIVTIDGTRPASGVTEGACHIYTSTGAYDIWSTGLKLQAPEWRAYLPAKGLVSLHAETGDLWGNTGVAWVNLTQSGKMKKCDGTDLPAGTGVATCDDLDAAIAGIVFPTVPVATDNVQGKVALNLGTALPGDATNCTDALTACGLNALLTDATAGGNTVINNVKALIPLATTTIPGLIEEATGEETRLGATDANRADRAVTPESMSYTLQTGANYKVHVSSATTNPVYGLLYTDSNTTASAVYGATTGAIGLYSGSLAHSFGGVRAGVRGNANGIAGVWAGYFDGNVAAGPITTLSDATLKEDVQAIDPAKALQFRNGLRWVSYEMFTEQQVEIVQTVADGEGNETQVPTGRYEVKRNSLGKKRGLIAQEVQALAASIGDFSDVVAEVGEYFTLDENGYPVKDADGKPIVNKRLGLDYDAVQFIICAGEQHDSRVTMKQARIALHRAGLLDSVENAVVDADKETQIDWEFSNFVDPENKTFNALAGALGITKEQVNSLIALAKTL